METRSVLHLKLQYSKTWMLRENEISIQENEISSFAENKETDTGNPVCAVPF